MKSRRAILLGLSCLAAAACGGEGAGHDSGIIPCTSDSACPLGWYCDDGICAPVQDGGGGCTFDSDCDPGQVCHQGACVDADPDGGVDGGDAADGGGDLVPDDPAIEVEPETVDFGNGRIGQTVEQQLLVRNAGGSDLTIFSLALEEGSSPEFGAHPLGNLNRVLPPEHDLPVVVRYAPVDGVVDQGALLISSDDPARALVRVPLSSSYKGASEITVVDDPAAAGPDLQVIDFGEVSVGGAARRLVYAKNTGRGNAVLTVEQVRTEPLSSAHYALEVYPQPPVFLSPDLGPCRDDQDCPAGHTCAQGACLDAAGHVLGAVTVAVHFAPEAAGYVQEQLVLTSDEEDAAGDGDERTLVIDLRGEGIQPGLEVTPDPIDFGGLYVGQQAALDVTLRNTGGEALRVSRLGLRDGGGPFGLEAVPEQPFDLAPGAQAGLVASYTPQAPGDHGNALEIESNAPVGLVRIDMTGNAIQPPVIGVSPAQLELGEVQLGEVASASLTVTNTGGSELVVDSIGLAAGASPAFSVLQSTLGQIAPGDSKTIDVVFAPTSPVGADTGVIEIGSNDPVRPVVQVAVTGLGTDPAVQVDPPAVAFGSIYVGYEAGPVILTVRNVGFGSMEITTIGMNTGSNPDFELQALPSLPLTLAGGESATTEVYFTPLAPGLRSGAVRVLTTDRDAPLVDVPVTGTGSDCPEGWWDINGDPDDGCEYECDLSNGGVEDCDGVDNDCDQQTDENLTTRTCQVTNQWGTCSGSETCEGEDGWVGCDAPTPAEEICDTEDNNCNGFTDADDPQLRIEPCENQQGACQGAVHRASLCVGGDWQPCQAWDYQVDPAYGVEICDGVDNDCDDSTDTGCDDDGDGWCDADMGFEGDPPLCSAGGGDCDDSDDLVHPGAQESCATAADDDCDGDTNDPGADGCSDYYTDGDDDGWGSGDPVCRCEPVGLVTAEQPGDCNDGNPDIHPGALEICGNSADEDCSGHTDDRDLDGDGHRDDDPACGGDDCDDADPDVHPGAAEVADTRDNDCNGFVDEGQIPAGAVVVTEIMFRPTPGSGEYFEVTNIWTQPVNLHSWRMRDDDPSFQDVHDIDQTGGVVIEPGEAAVLCADADPAANGGVDCDYDWTDFFLGNSGDEIIIELDGDEIDRVEYDTAPPWPNPDGLSLNLDPNAYELDANDAGENWCITPEDPAYQLASGDYGTPGDLNPSCSGALALLDVQPDSGIDAGGETITLLGAGFTGASAVRLGSLDCVTYQVTDDGHISCVTPAQPAGDYDVTVERGVSIKTLAGAYRYTAEASATSVDWAVLQHPDSITVDAGVPTPLVFGQVWIDGVTPQAGPPPGIEAQVGFGPAGSDPRATPGWLWFDAVWNPDCSNCNNGQNDEFMCSLTVEQAGSYSYACRFSDDGGYTFLYADLAPGTTDGFSAADLGALSVQ